jgi:pyrroloquinoline quinone (PQQ) biosynthesis protein C
MNERLRNEPPSTRSPESSRPHFATAEGLVDEYEQIDVATHPLFVDLGARPVDLSAIWLLVANLHAGISRDFVVWLAQTIARCSDRRVASVLAKQLNDELGNGDAAHIHSVLLHRFVSGLEVYRPHGSLDALLGPGRRLAEEGNELFDTRDHHEAIGALIVGEIFAKKMDRCLGDEIRRQSSIPAETLLWLTIHEVLEVDHADDSRELAALLPATNAAVSSATRGAARQWQSLWRFLDGVHALALAHRSARTVS